MERPGHLTAGRGETHLPHGFSEDKCGTQLPNEALSLSWDRTPLAGGMSKLPLRQATLHWLRSELVAVRRRNLVLERSLPVLTALVFPQISGQKSNSAPLIYTLLLRDAFTTAS